MSPLIKRGILVERTPQAVTLTPAKMEALLAADKPLPPEGGDVPVRQAQATGPQATDRVTNLHEMVGQSVLLDQVKLVIAGTQSRGTKMPHILLTGPSGYGKTTLSSIIAGTMQAEFVETNGMMIRTVREISNLLVKMNKPTVLFIDEIHATTKPVLEVLYEVMEDGKLSFVAEGVPITHEMPDLTIIGATTKPGELTEPFRQRFGFTGNVVLYTYEELATMVGNAWERCGVKYGKVEPMEVSRRSKGVPRRALHLAERVLDWAAASDIKGVPAGTVATALAAFGIDENGLDRDDWRIIDALTGPFGGRPVGIDALAMFLDMEPKTIQQQHEPFLCQCGVMARTRAGRIALPAAYELVGSRPDEAPETREVK